MAISRNNPRTNFHIDRTVLSAAVVLAAYPAFTAPPLEVIPVEADCLVYWVVYTRGAVGGRPVFRHESTNGTETVFDLIIDQGGFIAVSTEVGRISLLVEELVGPVPLAAVTNDYKIAINIKASIGARLIASELGVPGTPGTITITLTAIGKS